MSTAVSNNTLPWPVRLTYYFHILIEGLGAFNMLFGSKPEVANSRSFGIVVLCTVILAIAAIWRPAKLLLPASALLLLYNMAATAFAISKIVPAVDQAPAIIFLALSIHLVLSVGFAWALFKTLTGKLQLE